MSFSDELKSFRTDPASRRIIERWLEFGGVEELWGRVVRAEDLHLKEADRGQRLTPKELIQAVLSARYGVERLIEYESLVKQNFEELKDEFAVCVKAADSPREVDDAISEFKPKFEALGRRIYGFHMPTAVSRKNQNGSRTRKAFVIRMRGFLLPRCGREMDDVMAELLDIVFEGEAHSVDAARIARRATTKAGRAR